MTRRELVALAAVALVPHAWRATAPDIQFDDREFVAPATTIDGVVVRFPPVWSSFATVQLTRRPSVADAERLRRALGRVGGNVMAITGYGTPYFDRLPRSLVRSRLPRLRADRRRFAFEDAVAGPTDPPDVRLEANDLLFVVRGDVLTHVERALRTLLAPGLMRVTSRRLMFVQRGLPRRLAEQAGFAFAGAIHPESPMWMGFGDQQVGASGPPEIVTFAGNPSARLTTAARGDYFDHGSVLHLSHLVEDLDGFYAAPFEERVQMMFRSNPPPSRVEKVFIENAFSNPDDALREVGRVGHLGALQRASRAADGTPLHIRLDGPGLDAMDVGVVTPKLQFAMLVPTAELFTRMRARQASLDLAAEPRGIERFIRATRRQNFLVPPRRHRAFPLLELA